ncbi:MAG TPA: hypothetical protein VGW40_14525 [Allosphingosinicella sp.]|nr:hypothetical protein [Allosphingosinicella sp.]
MSSNHDAAVHFAELVDSFEKDGDRESNERWGRNAARFAAGTAATIAAGSNIAGSAASAAAGVLVDGNNDLANSIGAFTKSFGILMLAQAAATAMILTAPVWIPALIIKEKYFNDG